MSPELQTILEIQHPELYVQVHGEYGVECGDGWFVLLELLSDELAAHRDTTYAQIKEKFGILTVYLNVPAKDTDDSDSHTYRTVYDIVGKYEALSMYVCEHCGLFSTEDVTTSLNGWRKTLCSSCHKNLSSAVGRLNNTELSAHQALRQRQILSKVCSRLSHLHPPTRLDIQQAVKDVKKEKDGTSNTEGSVQVDVT